MPLSCFGMFTSHRNDPIIGPISESSPSDTPQESCCFPPHTAKPSSAASLLLGGTAKCCISQRNFTSECKDRTQKGSTKIKQKKISFFSLGTSSSTVKISESNQPWCNLEQQCHRGLCVQDLYSLKRKVFVLSFIW